MNNLRKLIKEVLSKHTHDCGCGCHGKCAKAPVLNESLGAKITMTENMSYHIANKKPLTENTFRYGSDAFLDLWAEARYLYSRDAIHLSGEDKKIITETNLGEYGIYEGKMVPLDMPMVDEEYDDSEDKDIEIDDRIKVVYGNKFYGQTGTVVDIVRGFVVVEMDEDGEEYSMHISDVEKIDNEDLDETVTGPDKDYVLTIVKKLKSQGKLDPDAEKVLYNYMNHPSGNREGVLNILKALDSEIAEASEYQGKKVQLNKPKRGGSKKFYVYVRDPKTKKVKKVSFGAAGGGQNLAVKIRDPKARRAFAKRQQCDKKKDRTKPGYWACNLPRYAKILGLKSSFSGYW